MLAADEALSANCPQELSVEPSQLDVETATPNFMLSIDTVSLHILTIVVCMLTTYQALHLFIERFCLANLANTVLVVVLVILYRFYYK